MVVNITHIPKEGHDCGPFPLVSLPAGTRGECDRCGQEWIVVSGAKYNETYRAWRRLTDKNKDGRDL